MEGGDGDDGAPDRLPGFELEHSPEYSPDAVLMLDRALRTIAAPSLIVGSRRIDTDDIRTLFPAELRSIRSAVARRQQEFASGRALLRQLIGYACEIPVAENRQPILPAGVRASLAHDRMFAVAAVSLDPHIVSIGIDIEPAETLSGEMTTIILRDDESDIDPHLAFTLKEATYKAWSWIGGRILDHHEVRLTIDGSGFQAEVTSSGTVFDGLFVREMDRWLALVVVEGEA